MPTFGKISAGRLATCDERLIMVMQEAIRTSPVDFTVVCGYRSNEDQAKACAEGKSKLGPGKSKHNSMPSRAVDICPFREGVGLVWNDREAFKDLAHHVLMTADRLGIALRWGGTWTGDADDAPAKFYDAPHFELKD